MPDGGKRRGGTRERGWSGAPSENPHVMLLPHQTLRLSLRIIHCAPTTPHLPRLLHTALLCGPHLRPSVSRVLAHRLSEPMLDRTMGELQGAQAMRLGHGEQHALDQASVMCIGSGCVVSTSCNRLWHILWQGQFWGGGSNWIELAVFSRPQACLNLQQRLGRR